MATDEEREREATAFLAAVAACPSCGSHSPGLVGTVPDADGMKSCADPFHDGHHIASAPQSGGQTFREELTDLINRHSKENGSNTPDFILGQYLNACLVAFDNAVKGRDAWYGVRMVPGTQKHWHGEKINPVNLLEGP
jgi:hypothetical protein